MKYQSGKIKYEHWIYQSGFWRNFEQCRLLTYQTQTQNELSPQAE